MLKVLPIIVYNRTGAQRYLDTARGASQLFLDNLPSTHIPPWYVETAVSLQPKADSCRNRDFNAPGSPATADTSAGAVAAVALINLATIERSLANTTGSDYYVQSAVDVRLQLLSIG